MALIYSNNADGGLCHQHTPAAVQRATRICIQGTCSSPGGFSMFWDRWEGGRPVGAACEIRHTPAASGACPSLLDTKETSGRVVAINTLQTVWLHWVRRK